MNAYDMPQFSNAIEGQKWLASRYGYQQIPRASTYRTVTIAPRRDWRQFRSMWVRGRAK